MAFAKAGATIASFDLRGTGETVELSKKEGVKAKGWELDASNEKAVNEAIDQVEKELGPISILVNCAGIVGSRPVMMEHYSNFWKTMEVNTGAVLSRPYWMQTMISMFKVLPLMKERRKGCIINIASRSGSLDLPGTLAYSVSKSAVIRAVGCIQLELNTEGLGDDIHVYALHPGGVLTDMPKSNSVCYLR
jgi:NAD(P)-dependent dehydrogenase (short-subunit alcohol dehydrogenase family)